VRLMSIENFELEMADFAIFLISTTGEGEPPDSMRKFWESLLMESLPEDLLEGF